MANQIRERCGFSVAKAGLHSRPYFLRRCWRCSLPSRTVRARLRILNWISYESRNVTMNVPTAARAARASKTFDISDTSKGKHRPRAGIRRCDSTARATAGDGAARVRQAARRSSVRWASVVASVKNGEGQNPPRCVSGVDPPTCESCRPCFGGQHRQQG